ncbi:MAG: class I SAM-dependent methyltransferase [Pseudomonadota bacterium]
MGNDTAQSYDQTVYWTEVGDAIPGDHAEQYTSAKLATRIIGDSRDISVLDLGCGDGRALDLFNRLDANIAYHGVDIEKSAEVLSRSRSDANFDTYDGKNLPYDTGIFDLVYSHQVFEHVEDPHAVIREIRRVLKPGGAFVGSASQLEPYHSLSLWNFTIYGFQKLCKDNGLIVEEFRPGIDSLTLIYRSYTRQRKRFARFFEQASPLHQRILREGRDANLSVKQLNHRMITYSGHICFVARPRSFSY